MLFVFPYISLLDPWARKYEFKETMGLEINMENRFGRVIYRLHKCITPDLQHWADQIHHKSCETAVHSIIGIQNLTLMVYAASLWEMYIWRVINNMQKNVLSVFGNNKYYSVRENVIVFLLVLLFCCTCFQALWSKYEHWVFIANTNDFKQVNMNCMRCLFFCIWFMPDPIYVMLD